MGLNLANMVLQGVVPTGLGYIQGQRMAKQEAQDDLRAESDREMMGLRKMQMDEQVKAMRRAEKEREHEEEAQSAAAKALNDRVAAGQASRQTGLDGAMGTVAGAPYQPTKDDMLHAGDVYAQSWLKRGNTKRYIEADAKNESMRLQMRESAIKQHMGAWTSTGDPTQLLKSINQYSANDVEDVSVRPGKSQDGTPLYEVTTIHKGGKRNVVSATPDDIARQVEAAVDPIGSFKSWRSIRLEEIKSVNAEAKDAAKERLRLDREKELEGVRHKNSLGLIGARGAEERRTNEDRATNPRLAAAREKDDSVAALREARLDLDNAKNRAIQVRIKDSMEAMRLSPQERDALVDGHPDVQAARERLSAVKDYADRVRSRKEESSGPGLSSASSGSRKALPMPDSPGKLQAGQTYDTSRGPAKWNGKAFEQQ